MSFISSTVQAFEGAPIPDVMRRVAIELLVANARRRLGAAGRDAETAFALEMAQRPIAEHAAAANDQHYELPAAFFEKVLGPQLKYSSCLYGPGVEDLAAAEENALSETADHAGLADGQEILELGCGWGSLTLWMARALPNARITAVSNSASQGDFIRSRAGALGLTNVTVVTADMNVFEAAGRFDRVVSVEMFEHMANWRALLTRVRGWLKPEGRAFIHVFTHRTTPYRFDVEDEADWIAQHFFSGGVMPSHGLMAQFPDLFEVEADWRWSGRNYERTALHWLENFDRHDAALREVLAEVYGDASPLWRRRWRLFFLATAGLFGHRDGQEWGVSHYRLKPSA
ncbi:MAG: cyclopropane-fatty-acyl-phospholipid synthase family protein [Phenylobacterium sp.]|uniref:SAM-dependent methyltransferase n=1 Tax=Phenylobacterium sp. TaxID=1871053 RepID=UPI00272387DD|nr:cyclopropane-fatty-acyl-phospholipid synthase family protein [Phenylobacterium sp.]MDO8409643.1 cyclopropane-fatty-acyl-phospholipid synthase family protein [Phenylobacterium sp.]